MYAINNGNEGREKIMHGWLNECEVVTGCLEGFLWYFNDSVKVTDFRSLPFIQSNKQIDF